MRSLLMPFALNLSFALLAAQAAAAQKFAITDLGTRPGGMASVGNGINPSGQMTGDLETSGSASHAFLYSKGKISDLGFADPILRVVSLKRFDSPHSYVRQRTEGNFDFVYKDLRLTGYDSWTPTLAKDFVDIPGKTVSFI